MGKSVSRLVESFRPDHYKLELDPDRDTKKITGIVTITGHKVGKPSKRLTFHQHTLKVKSATIEVTDKKGKRELPVIRIGHQRSLQEVNLRTSETLYPGAYKVTMQFEGVVSSGMSGVYFADYQVNGQTKTIVSTQFESHYARMMMPCIDEPEAKATFDITLSSPLGEVVLGNTPPKSQTKKGNKLVTTFEATPKTSTYLLAFVYGDLQSRQAKTKRGIDVRVWATKAHAPEALDYALDAGVRSIDFFEEYYGVEYPLAKCDHVAVPEFSSGAMENWGLITYRESALLADPKTATQARYDRVVQVVTHEVSHQWFGNLVTMKWWDNLWLNESFARLMEFVATDSLYPEWHIWDRFASGPGLAALRRDAINGVQAVQTPVRHPDEIGALFDPAIVYAKGARVLGMLMNYLGQDDFRAGLKLYFTKHAYANTHGDDLWAAFSKASGKDIADFMQPWVSQPGFPVIKVTQNDKQLNVAQSHFLLDPQKADTKRLWPVPLLTSGDRGPELLATPASDTTLITSDYVHVNKDALGHYVVHYVNPEHADAIATMATEKGLTEPERLMLLHDSALLARGGEQTFTATLDLLDNYVNEDAEPVWAIIDQVLADCRNFTRIDSALEQPLNNLARRLIAAQHERLGWSAAADEPVQDTKLRAMIITLGLEAEDPSMVAEAKRLFTLYQKDQTAIPSDLLGSVLGAVVKAGVTGAFSYLLAADEATQNVDVKAAILSGLSKTQDVKQIKILLGRLTDTGKVRKQDIVQWYAALMINPATQEPTWQWLQSNWDWVQKTYADDKTYDFFPRAAATTFNTPRLLNEYINFFEPLKKQAALTRTITIGVEELQNRIAWLERDVAGVRAYFESGSLTQQELEV